MNPLDLSLANAVRTVIRNTPKSLVRSSSVGRSSAAPYRPDRI
jgi:hypothetical protein